MLTTNNYPRRCRTGGTSTFGIASSGILSSRSKLPLRSYYKPRNTINSIHIENAPFGRPKRFKIKKISSCQKMDSIKKKIPDYTETAYREAVSRLKYLLAESYTPRSGKVLRERNIYRRSNTKLHESADETDEQSISECSKGFSTTLLSRRNVSDKNRLPLTSALMTDDSQLTPKELSSLIMRQEEYIEQLESESRFCKDELKNLLGKIREVVAENEVLHDKNKTTLLKSFLTEFNDNEERVDKILGNKNLNNEGSFSEKPIKLHQITEGPSIIFESRISELEAQLTQARIELRKAQEENQACVKKISDGGGISPNSEAIMQVDQVMKEKREINFKLEEALRNLKSAREKEIETSQKAKRAQDSFQQAEFEKSQMEAEIRRLKDELERQREKIREAAQETSRRLAEERHQVERRYSQQIEQLTADIAMHWDTVSKSQLEVDKQRREITDLKRELNQKQAIIDDLKKELVIKTSNLQSDMNQLVAEKDAIEQELAAAKLAAERNERRARQEQSRWQIEINSYKQRLERADADIVHCRRENLRLSEQIASLEKELNMEKITHGGESQTPAATPRLENEKDMTSMIMDMETKHAATVAGLEDSLGNQAKLVSRLNDECQSLTLRLEANNLYGYSVLTEEAGETIDGSFNLATLPLKKKRSVKVDLVLKINPKKKPAILKFTQAPLSAQKEMVSLQNNIEFLTNKISETFANQQGKLTETQLISESSSNQKNVSSHEEINNTVYSVNDNENHPQNYDNNQQNKNQVIDSSHYPLQNDENYQDYTLNDPNYQDQYVNQDYQQYEQYDPSFYQQESNNNNQQNN